MLSREDKEFCRNYIYATRWQAAKSKKYENAPHEYTVKAWNPAKKSEFETFVKLIRKHGYPAKFNNSTYIYLDIDNKKYWTQTGIVRITILINKTDINSQ